MQVAPENYLATGKLGNIYLMKRQYDRAFPYLEKAIQQKPDLGQADRDLGRALVETGDFERAIIHLKKVTQLAPEIPATHYILAQAYRKVGSKAEEKAELERFEQLRKAGQERDKGRGILTAGTQEETKEGSPEDVLPDP